MRVNAIAPGFISTEMNVALVADETRNRQILERIPAGRWGCAEDIAGAALFLASDAAGFVHGTVLARRRRLPGPLNSLRKKGFL